MAASNEKKSMNSKQRKCMTEWQQETGSVTERDELLVQQNFWTDVTVIVGAERKTFECHGLYLAKCSSVFAAMLYSQEEIQSEIVLPEISARTFSLILKYVYNPERGVELQDRSDASALLKAAQNYELPSALAETCEALLYSDEVSVIEPPPKKNKTSWQQTCHLMVDRDKHILQDKLWTDCRFNIAESQVFHCHKLMLAKTSPVFAAMLFSELSRSGEDIDITDVTVASFSQFITYCYTGSLGLDLCQFVNSGEVWDFLYLAKKYLLPERLLSQLQAWIFSQIYTDTFWDILREAENNDEQTIMNSCMQILRQFTPYCLGVPSFLSAPHRLLKKLVDCDFLSCSELELFNACVRWAKHLLAASEVEESGENMRQTLGTVLHGLRLKAFTSVEFIRGPSKSGLFTQQECYQILVSICDPTNECLPSNLCASPSRDSKVEAIYIHGCSPTDFPRSILNQQNTYSALCMYENLQGIECCLVGLQIFTQEDPEDTVLFSESKRSYDEDMTVVMFQKQDVATKKEFKIISEYSVQNSVKYGTMINFQLPKYINTCMHSSANLCAVILPHKSGLYQVNKVSNLQRTHGSFMNVPSIKLYQMKGQGFLNCVVYSPRSKDRPCSKHAIYPEQPSTSGSRLSTTRYGRIYPCYDSHWNSPEDVNERMIDEFFEGGGYVGYCGEPLGTLEYDSDDI